MEERKNGEMIPTARPPRCSQERARNPHSGASPPAPQPAPGSTTAPRRTCSMLRPAMGGTIHRGRSRRLPGCRSGLSLLGSITVPTPAHRHSRQAGRTEVRQGRVRGRQEERLQRLGCSPASNYEQGAGTTLDAQAPASQPAPSTSARRQATNRAGPHRCSRAPGALAQTSPQPGWHPLSSSLPPPMRRCCRRRSFCLLVPASGCCWFVKGWMGCQKTGAAAAPAAAAENWR